MKTKVLILVLVEDGLGGKLGSRAESTPYSLNPCFSGGWSRRFVEGICEVHFGDVLILVLVEDGLGVLLVSFV